MELNFKEFITGVVLETSILVPESPLVTFHEWLMEAEQPLCPECGSIMYLRTGPYSKFYGCSKWSSGCTGKRNPDLSVIKSRGAKQTPAEPTVPVQKPSPSQAQPQEEPQPQEESRWWTYAKIKINNTGYLGLSLPKKGKEIAVAPSPDKHHWDFIVLKPDGIGWVSKGIIPAEHIGQIIESFKRDGKPMHSMNPSLQDLEDRLNGKIPEPDTTTPEKEQEPEQDFSDFETDKKNDHKRPTTEQVKIAPERMTKYNTKIQDKFVKTKQNIMIDALAGTGKTTMLKHLSSFIKPGEKWLYLVFNKKNQVESESAFPKGVDVLTTHAFLGKLLKRNGKRVGGATVLPPKNVKWKKINLVLDKIAPSNWPKSVKEYNGKNGPTSPFNWGAKSLVLKLASLAKNTALIPTDPKIKNQLQEIIKKHGMQTDLSTEKYNQDRDYTPDMVDKCIELMKYTMPGALPKNLESQDIANVRDQDDTLWFSALHADELDWRNPYSVVLLDEVQDFNKCQLIMAKKLKEVGCRVVGVGDPNQAMYLFRGSDAAAFKELKGIIGSGESEELPINFRSGGNIIDWVTKNTHVKNLQSSDHLKGVGEVYANGGTKPALGYPQFKDQIKNEFDKNKKFNEATCIISRTNKPLAEAALGFLKNNINFEIVGKDLSKELVDHINKVTWSKPEKFEIDDFANTLGDYFENVNKKWNGKIAKRDELKEIEELTETLVSVLEFLREKDYKDTSTSPEMRTAKDFLNYIVVKMGGVDETDADAMAAYKNKDPNSFVTLTTAHKCKGLEWDRVFVMEPGNFDPENEKNVTEEQKQQERNSWYVACTRAKKSLYIDALHKHN